MYATVYDHDIEDADLTSYLTVRHSRKNYKLVERLTEVAGLDRRSHGGRKTATDNAAPVATQKNGQLKCSDCKLMKDDELFPLSTIFLHRHAVWIEDKKDNGEKIKLKLCGRGYQCRACQKKRREEAKQEAIRFALWQKRQQEFTEKQAKKTKKNKLRAEAA